MNDRQIAELRVSLMKAIEEWSDDDVCATLDMYWSKNLVARAADAALNVLLASKEGQEEAKENDL